MRSDRRGRLERLQSRLMMAGDLQSPYQSLDVDLDLRVSRQDAVEVLNVLNQEVPEESLGNGLFPDVTGDGLTTPLDALRIINSVHRGTPVVCARLTHDSAFAGDTDFDLLTNDPGIEIWSSASPEQLEFTLDGTTNRNLGDYVVDGRVLLTADVLDSLASSPLAEGEHSFEIGIAGQQATLHFVVTVDRIAPEPTLASDEGRLRQQTKELTLLFDEPVTLGSLQPDVFSLQTIGNVSDGAAIPVQLTAESEYIELRFADVLRNAEYRLVLPDTISDAAGNASSVTELFLTIEQLAFLDMNPDSQFVTIDAEHSTVSVLWDVAVQQAVAATSPGPTIASRAYAMVHTATYDAWSAYDPVAVSTRLADSLQRPVAENTDANKSAAMSQAAYRVLVDLFPAQQAIFDEVMTELGYDVDASADDPLTPAGIGKVMADAVLSYRHQDGANQRGDSPDGLAEVPYSNTTAYNGINQVGGTSVIDRWTPEVVPLAGSGSAAGRNQEFLTPHWGNVVPFALESPDQYRPSAPQPFLLVDGSVDLENRTITLDNGTTVAIDRSIVGTIINPAFIEQAEDVIEASAALTDEQKLIAEFWEDAKGTSFPPGTWMSFGQFVSARDEHSLDDDAKLFFALSNAVFDAGIATWEAKVHYDYARPVRVIHELGRLGLIGEFDAARGGHVIEAWTAHGPQTILATSFLTYQTPGGDPSPPFAEYTSGHSSFSAAGATILERFTGQDAFGGEVMFDAGQSRFQPDAVPAEPVTLRWETFREAADEAGLSRIYGAIHFSEGDERGRSLGNDVGDAVWERTQQYILGTIGDGP